MSDLRVISADSHSNEPLELFGRLPAEYRHRAPREETIDGKRYWMIEGESPMPLEAPHPLSEDDQQRYWRDGEEVGRVMHRAGGTDIALRLEDQEKDGVSAEVIYPHASIKAFTSPDPGYQLAVARVANDWYMEIFGEYPDQFVVAATIPMIDVDDAISEALRTAKMGYRSFCLPVTMPARPYNLPEYEPFWATVAELGVSLSFHVFNRGPGVIEPTSEKWDSPGCDLSVNTLGMAEAMSPITLLIGSGVLERHPALKVVVVECGIGWLAWCLQIMDELHHKRHMWMEPQLPMLPSEYFKRQGYLTFGDDAVGLHNLEFTGVDSLMWGSDYPHDEGTFPHSREVIERTFAGISREDKEKIVGGNAASLYGFPLA